MSSEDLFNENETAAILDDVEFEYQTNLDLKSNIHADNHENLDYTNIDSSYFNDYGLTGANKSELIQLMIGQLKSLGLDESSKVLRTEFEKLKIGENNADQLGSEVLSQKKEISSAVSNEDYESQFLNLVKFGDFENAEKLIINKKIPLKQNIDLFHLSTHIKDDSLISTDKVLIKIHEIFQVHKILEILVFENNLKLGIDLIKSMQHTNEYYPQLIAIIADVKCKTHPLIQNFGFYKDLKFARNYLLQQVLSQYLEFENIILDDRLFQLISQAKKFQFGPENNLFGSLKSITGVDSAPAWSLFKNYRYPIENFPCKLIETQENSPNHQIWSLNFSYDGKYLAAISNTNDITVYHYNNNKNSRQEIHQPVLQPYSIFKGHSENVVYLSWNPVFPSQFITCSFDHTVRIWDVEKKKCIRFMKCSKIARVIHWAHDGKGFYCGSNEMELCYYNVDTNDASRIDENPKFIWNGLKVADFEVTSNGKYLISSYKDCITVISLKSCLVVNHFKIAKGNATSVKLASSKMDEEQSTILINVLPNLIQLYNWKSGIMLKQYFGLYQDKYIVRSCFLQDDEQIVCCGSIDGKLFFWNKEKCSLLLVLKIHQGLVNSVIYRDNMLFSAGDDGRINVWGSSKMLAARSEDQIAVD